MSVKWMTVTLVLLASGAIRSGNAKSSHQMSAQNRLLKDLLANYGYTTMRPVSNLSNPTTVELRLILTQVIELNERHQTIEIGAWITQRWTDEYMTWDPDDHDGVDHLYVHKSMIWLPDITIYKNVDRDFESYKDISVGIRSTGVVTRDTPVILKFTCRIDARLFPFDTQVCELRFTSWVYDITAINLTEYREHARQRFYTDVGVWELLNITSVRQETTYEDGTVYPDLSYFILLRRQPLFHILQIIIPCVLLSLLNLTVFVLPPESGEKISLGVTNLLSLVLFQQLISVSVPPTADNAPIIGYYFTPMIALACTSIVCTVAVLNVFYRDNRRPIPRWVRYIIFDILARLVCHRANVKTSPNTMKSRSARERFLTLEPSRMDTACPLTNSPVTATGNAGEVSPSKSHYRRVGDWDDARFRTLDITHQLCAVALPKKLDPPVMRARRHVHGEADNRQEQNQTGKLQTAHNWREVALVMDRTALVLSSVITLSSMVTCVITFIVHFQQLDP